MGRDKQKEKTLALVIGLVPVLWFALLIAPYVSDGIPGIVRNFGGIMEHPFRIQFCGDSLKTVLTFLVIYGVAAAVILSSDRNYRKREEHGSAKWGNAKNISQKYANPNREANKILTQHVSIGLDGRKHRRNLNVMVCGGSGSGKTRFYAKPNLLQATDCSYVVLAPKGTLYGILNAENHA